MPSPSQQAEWNAFIDVLDLAGQAGALDNVEIPPLAGAVAGKRFGELTSGEVKDLARVANAQGCRGDILVVMWRDVQWKARQQRKSEQKRRGRGQPPAGG